MVMAETKIERQLSLISFVQVKSFSFLSNDFTWNINLTYIRMILLTQLNECPNEEMEGKSLRKMSEEQTSLKSEMMETSTEETKY